MGEWSPECRAGGVARGVERPGRGARFIGHNQGGPGGLMKWSRRGRVITAEPGREFAFVTEEGGREGTEWRYRLEPVEGGTVVTESYTVSMDPGLGPHRRRPDQPGQRAARAMGHTLEQLKAPPSRHRRPDRRVPRIFHRSNPFNLRTRHQGVPLMHTYHAAPDVDVVTSTAKVGGFGNLAINAFVLHAAEPVLVDTGAVVDSDDFMARAAAR